MEFYNKLRAGERLIAIGAALVILSYIVAIAGRGFGLGAGSLGLLGAIAVLVILFLKYSPTQNINWPIQVELINLGIAAVVGLSALLTLLEVLSLISLLGITAILALALFVIGAAVMVWGAWQEYQAMPKTTPPSSNNPPAA